MRVQGSGKNTGRRRSRRAGWFAMTAALGLIGCSEKATSPAAGKASGGPVEVVVHEVKTERFVDEAVAVGTLQADESAAISTNVTERVDELLFDDGQRVEEGQVLARLASRQEEAMQKSAAATKAEEEREVERLRPLVERGAVAESELAARRTRLAVAEAMMAQAEAQIADRSIRAPFAGIVGLRRISPGALVEPGDVITTLDKTDTMKLDFTVPETFLGSLEPGLVVTASSAAYPDRDFEGRVAEVDTRIDPVTRSVAVRALVPNEDGALRPGMLMTVRLDRNPQENIAVPERAIVPVGESRFIFKVEADVAKRVPVKTGRREPGYVEVVSGLEAGDLVVTDGVQALQDGTPVKVAGRFEGPVEAFDPKLRPSS